MNTGTQHSQFSAMSSDTCMKGHKKRNKICKEGEDCASSTFYGNAKKTKKEASNAAGSFDPFSIPHLSRALDKNIFGSVTEDIEALRALKLRRLNSSLKMKPTQSFKYSDVEKSQKTKRRCFLDLTKEEDSQPAYKNAINEQISSPVHHVAVGQLASLQANKTSSDQSVTQPEHDSIHLEDVHSGNDKKETGPIIIIDSDEENDGTQRPSHQCHKAVQRGTAAEPSIDDLKVSSTAEKEAPEEEVGSAATNIDMGLNKSIDPCLYVEARCCVVGKAPEEEPSNTLQEIIIGMDESVDQVTSCLKREASEEEEEVGNVSKIIDVRSNDYRYNEIVDDIVIESKPSERLDQITSSSERKALEGKVEAAPNIIDVRSVKCTYIESDDGMIKEDDQIDIADGMEDKLPECVDHVTSCSERKALEEESVPNIDVRPAKNTYSVADNIMMLKEASGQIDIADGMGSRPSESVDRVTSCSRREALEEESVPHFDGRPAKNSCNGADDIMTLKEASEQIDLADDMASKPSENAIEMDRHVSGESSGEKLENCHVIKLTTDKGMYIGTNDDLVTEEDNTDGLADIWEEMALALNFSKNDAPVPTANENSKEDYECDHSFVFKDDLGDVCRICGIIDRGIETIFEFQYNKVKRTTRSYMSDPHNTIGRVLSGTLPSEINSLRDNPIPTEIFVHPRHRAQMKPHQADGFNFLCSNLLADDPGGCILAHAPGSGKTFMIISFIQSFLAKYPEGRPLIVLPKGILATWKKEFQIWQIEDIPILDFYTSKAENRYQQLEVLLQWQKHRSILLLGYKQFSAIVCDSKSYKEAADCQDKLLKVPTILILDEGHTPRNENTDVLQSLAKVRTPRKVVLSGTLYQNHVKEVFNILNLVRPKFLKFNTSRDAVSRIMSKVQISGARKHLKAGNGLAFYDLVEYTLQKDENFERKVAIIKDLREMTSKVLHYYKGLDELPGLVDYTVVLNLSEKQKEEVQKLKKSGKFSQISDRSALYVHPQLKYFLEKNTGSADRNSSVINEKIDQMLVEIDVRHGVKLKFFLNMLDLCESTGEKLLVFSQFILPLKLLERLSMNTKGWIPGKEIFSITGDSTPEQREWSMQRFNISPDAKVFLGSIKACGEGISLVGASRIIILDVHLNPSVTRQAIGRGFRPGQKRKVYTYRLVAAHSPEEDNYLACSRKDFVSKIWFEWSETCEFQDFEMNTVDFDKCDDLFLQSPFLQEDIKVLYKR